MRLVIQRVRQAGVTVPGAARVDIGPGLMVLVGIAGEDTLHDAAHMARKTADLRIFDDGAGKMNLSLRDTKGACLVVSQFTLYGNCRKGQRPSFVGSAPPEQALALYRRFGEFLRAEWPEVAEGVFGAMMEVSLTNDGPVTLILEREATQADD